MAKGRFTIFHAIAYSHQRWFDTCLMLIKCPLPTQPTFQVMCFVMAYVPHYFKGEATVSGRVWCVWLRRFLGRPISLVGYHCTAMHCHFAPKRCFSNNLDVQAILRQWHSIKLTFQPIGNKNVGKWHAVSDQALLHWHYRFLPSGVPIYYLAMIAPPWTHWSLSPTWFPLITIICK